MRKHGICPDGPPTYVAGNDGVELKPGATAWWLHRGDPPQLREVEAASFRWDQGHDGYEAVVVTGCGRVLAPCLLYGSVAVAREDYAALLAARTADAESRARAYRATLEAFRAGESEGGGVVPCQSVS